MDFADLIDVIDKYSVKDVFHIDLMARDFHISEQLFNQLYPEGADKVLYDPKYEKTWRYKYLDKRCKVYCLSEGLCTK